MINHVRNLLMNVDGSSTPGDMPGEEYIPPAYRAMPLPAALRRVRNVLYGDSPDRLMLNYRTREFLQVLHATELTQFITAFDTRITYDFRPVPEALGTGVVVSRLAGDESVRFNIYGDYDKIRSQNALYREWDVDVADGTEVSIHTRRPVNVTELQEFTVSSGRSSLIRLPYSELNVRFNTEDGAHVGSKWRVKAYGRPALSAAELAAACAKLSEESIIALFGPATASVTREPYGTFYRLWNKHPELPYSLGGLVLALAYRTEESRRVQRNA